MREVIAESLILKFIRIHSYKLILLYFLVGLLMNLYTSFINVDVYHEGDKFPSVVSMSQGGMVFRDANQMYGFLTTILSIPLTNLIGAHLIAMRITGFLCLVILVFLFIKVLSFIVSRSLAIFVAGSWLVISPSWTNLNDLRFSNGFAWPTHYGILFILASVLLWPKVIRPSNEVDFKLFISSLCMAIAWSARLEFIATWVLVSLFIVVQWRRKEFSSKQLFFWVFGGVLYFLGSCLWLLHQGALYDGYQQTILVWFSNPPAQPKFTFIWLAMNAFSFVAIAGLSLVCFLIIYFFKPAILRACLVSATLIVGFSVVGTYVRPIEIGGFHVGAWLFEISNRGVLSLVNVCFATGLFSSFLILKRFYKSNIADEISNIMALLAVINISLLAMLHITNADYIHIFSMPFIAVTIWTLKYSAPNFPKISSRVSGALIATILVFAFVASAGFISGASQGLSPYRSKVLIGLFDQDPATRTSIDAKMDTVASYSKDGIWSFCISGLPTIATGSFAGKDHWVWNLEPELWMTERWGKVKKDDFMYVCSLSDQENRILTRNLANENIIKVEDGDGFSIYQAKRKLT